MTTQKQLNELTFEIIGAAIEVHKTMGKGLLEKHLSSLLFIRRIKNKKHQFYFRKKYSCIL